MFVYTSKVEIPVSRYLQEILRAVFVFGSSHPNRVLYPKQYDA